MARLSFFLPVRIQNKISNFERWFDSLEKNIFDKDSVEVLIKFDDDEDLVVPLEIVEKYRDKGFQIKHIITPRGRGYNDISFFYAQLFLISAPESQMMMAGSIDLLFVKQGFDKDIIDASKKFDDGIFVVHTLNTSSIKDKITNVNIASQYCDNFPIWSRRWIEICGAHFGYCSSNDGYTGIVEYLLTKNFGLDRRIAIDGIKMFEESHTEGLGTSHWDNARRNSMRTNLSEQVISLANQAAQNIAYNVSNSYSRDDYIKYLTESCFDNYDLYLKEKDRANAAVESENNRLRRKKRARNRRSAIYIILSLFMIISVIEVSLVLSIVK